MCLSFVYTCGMAEARESMLLKLTAGNALERLWAHRAGLEFSMVLASGEVVKPPPKSACHAARTVHCPSADTDLCIAINSQYRLFHSYDRLGTNSYMCS